MSRVKDTAKRKKAILLNQNLNLNVYKNLLLNKLKDSLEITDFDMDGLKLNLSYAATTSIRVQTIFNKD